MKNNLKELWHEELPDDYSPTPVELLIKEPTRGDEPARQLPGGSAERRRLDEVPDYLLLAKEVSFGGWQTTLRLRRRSLDRVYELVYRSERSGLPCLDGNPEDEIELIGYWD